MKSLRIAVTQIPSEGCIKELDCLPSDLSFEPEEIEVSKPIKVTARLKKEIDFIHLKGEISVNLKLHCSRCLEDFKKDFRYNLNLEFPVRREQTSIDITEALRQELILNYPFKILCSPDCKGLCPVCGANLNKGRCNCKVNSVQ